MPNNDEKKVLLKVTDLKQWFPLKKTKLFQKEQEYVRANDGITLNIYEGETVGLVGETGCGKYRRAFSGNFHRSEIHKPESEVNGRNGHGDLRLFPAALCKDRSATLSKVWKTDQQADS